MANDKNLIQNQSLTPSERRDNARKAGIASGKARRERQQIRAIAQEVLSGTFTVEDRELTGSELLTQKIIEVIQDTSHKDWYKTVELLVKLTNSDVTPTELELSEAQAAYRLEQTKQDSTYTGMFSCMLEQL